MSADPASEIAVSPGAARNLPHLTVIEQAAVARAAQLLERTHYDQTERTMDARALAYAMIEMAQQLDWARGSALVARAERDRFMQIAGYAR